VETDGARRSAATANRKAYAVSCESRDFKRTAQTAAMFQTHPQLSGIIMAEVH